MAITDIAKQPPPDPTRKGPACAVCAALESLPPEEAAALTDLLSDKDWRFRDIAYRVKNDEDYPLDIAHGTYARHAKGECWDMRQAGRKLR